MTAFKDNTARQTGENSTKKTTQKNMKIETTEKPQEKMTQKARTKKRQEVNIIQCKIWKLENEVASLLRNEYNEYGLDLVQIKTAKMIKLKKLLSLIQESLIAHRFPSE